jgi:hypothetical protein
MSRRRRPSRVPPAYRSRLERVVAVASEHSEPGGVYVLPVQHDDDCPALFVRSLRACRCDPIVCPPRRVA